MLKSHKVRLQGQGVTKGFTLLEMLVVLVMIGVLSAIVAPGWLAFYNHQRLNAAQNKVFEALNQAKKTSTLKRLDYQVSFREQNDQIEWAIHPTLVSPTNAVWNRLEKGVLLDHATTLYEKDGIYRMRFNHRGEASGQIGQVVLSLSPESNKRCVIISTLLGTIRQGEFEQRTRSCKSK